MTTVFEIQKSLKRIKYGAILTEEELMKHFGVSGLYSFTSSAFDKTSFLFYGRTVEGNTHTKVSKTGEVTISTVLRSEKPYDGTLNPEETEIGDIIFLIQKTGKGYVFRGVADLNNIKITHREKENDVYWLLTCTYHGRVRDEENAYSLEPIENNDFETIVYIPTAEGRKKAVYTTKYERNPANRAAAIATHGTVCMACGFDFGKTYGEYGKGYIEVHHAKPLFENTVETIPDPETDLICLCSNCHRMVHHFKNRVLTLEELKQILVEA